MENFKSIVECDIHVYNALPKDNVWFIQIYIKEEVKIDEQSDTPYPYIKRTPMVVYGTK